MDAEFPDLKGECIPDVIIDSAFDFSDYLLVVDWSVQVIFVDGGGVIC
jgi:hypothetical protein